MKRFLTAVGLMLLQMVWQGAFTTVMAVVAFYLFGSISAGHLIYYWPSSSVEWIFVSIIMGTVALFGATAY